MATSRQNEPTGRARQVVGGPELDETKYREDLLTKHRSPQGALDLLARYAITLPATDADIARRVGEVRVLEKDPNQPRDRIGSDRSTLSGRGRTVAGRARREDGDCGLVAGATVRPAARSRPGAATSHAYLDLRD